MNEELKFAFAIRRALDDAAARLPYRTVHRLRRAREAALARLPAAVDTAPNLVGVGASLVLGGPPQRGQLARKLLSTLVPLALLVAGFVAISVWNDIETAEETSDVELGVLTDSVPISAYTDRGFGTYLKNAHP